ncbi:hypothetical protein [Trinickia mobilis]|uniref:hypothetical protein n=1 Tax=Trinickia mobilis TaxID=2816356 RepID=UPI001A8C5526|nr:hypothetical protein [Trinickia mobilis]
MTIQTPEHYDVQERVVNGICAKTWIADLRQQPKFSLLLESVNVTVAPRALLTASELRELCNLLNKDLTPWLPADTESAEYRLAASRFHFGQPVKLDSDDDDAIGALRIAMSARLVSEIWADGHARQQNDRLNRVIGDVRAAITKLLLVHQSRFEGCLASNVEWFSGIPRCTGVTRSSAS